MTLFAGLVSEAAIYLVLAHILGHTRPLVASFFHGFSFSKFHLQIFYLESGQLMALTLCNLLVRLKHTDPFGMMYSLHSMPFVCFAKSSSLARVWAEVR